MWDEGGDVPPGGERRMRGGAAHGTAAWGAAEARGASRPAARAGRRRVSGAREIRDAAAPGSRVRMFPRLPQGVWGQGCGRGAGRTGSNATARGAPRPLEARRRAGRGGSGEAPSQPRSTRQPSPRTAWGRVAAEARRTRSGGARHGRGSGGSGSRGRRGRATHGSSLSSAACAAWMRAADGRLIGGGRRATLLRGSPDPAARLPPSPDRA
jgi:hypothetical protein